MDKTVIDNTELESALSSGQDIWQILSKTQVIMPMHIDANTALDPLGNVYLPPDAKVTPMFLADKENKQYFPLFTSFSQLHGLENDKRVTCVYVSVNQIMQFIRDAGPAIKGVVINPYQQAVIFSSLDLLRQEGRLEKQAPESPKLRMPVKVNMDLEDVLVKFVRQDDEARSVYLLERLVTNEASRYYVVIDGLKPEKLEWLANQCLPYTGGKELEFNEKHSPLLFGLLNDFEPLYVKEKKA